MPALRAAAGDSGTIGRATGGHDGCDTDATVAENRRPSGGHTHCQGGRSSCSMGRMNAIRRHLPSPSMLVACTALVISLGGVSYAATALPKSSVGTQQLKKKAVTASKLRVNAVTGTKVKDGTLLAGDFGDGQLPAGPQGPKGEQGSKGEPGVQGPKGDPGATKVVTRTATGNPAAQGGFTGAHVSCAEGETLVGGGFATASTGSAEPVVMQSSADQPGSGWVVFVRNAGTAAGTVTPCASARCASP
jgi:hypothetical protein